MPTGHFVGDVILEQDGWYWVLQDPISYIEIGLRLDVPAGFVSDLASIPRILWNIFPPFDPEYSAAAICHDRAYEVHALSRADADAMLFRAMTVNGTPAWKRWVIYRAVRMCGASAYATGPARQAERLQIDAGRG